MAYPLEVFKEGESRVMFGPEEHAEAKKDGWSDEREAAERPKLTWNPIPQEITAIAKRRGRPPLVRINEVA